MISKNLADAVAAIKDNKADSREIQSKVTYSELIPLLFRNNYGQVAAEREHNTIRKEENGRHLYPDEIFDILNSRPHAKVQGVNASAGLGMGKIAFNYKTIDKLLANKESLIFLRQYMIPGDVHYQIASSATVTTEGGATSHAAVTGRQFHLPVVVGCSQIHIDFEQNRILLPDQNHVFYEETEVLVDGTRGNVYFFLDKQTRNELSLIVDMQDDDTLEIISNFIYNEIQNHEIYSFGLELAFLVMILKMRSIESLSDVAALSVDFEYLSSFKQDSVLWMVLLPNLKKFCSRVRDFVNANSTDHISIKKDLLLLLSRMNDMASKSVDHRHQMTLFQEALRKLDNLISLFTSEHNKQGNTISPNILVVEDEPYLIADTIQRLKSELNANVNIITNAQDAIEVIKSAVVLDLAIVDLMIPSGKDQNLDFDPYKGVSVSQKIKEMKGENFPIIFLTSVRDTNVLAKIFNSTVSRVINEPSLASSIIETAKEMLQNTNLSDASLLQGEIQRRKLELESPDPNMRIRALWALFQYANHDQEIMSKINLIAEKDSHEQVKLIAKKILAQPLILKNEQFDYQSQKGNRPTDSRSVVIQGNVQNSIIILGDENSVQSN